MTQTGKGDSGQHCPTTGKRRFAKRSKALRQANYWWGFMPGEFWRAYRCQFCGSWHLTSQPNKRQGPQGVTDDATG